MTTDNMTRNEKRQYNINRKVAKISALSYDEIDKNKYLIYEEILPYDESRTMKQGNKILENLFKERFDKIIELTDETNFDNLRYYLEGDSSRKRFGDFKNGTKLFGKIKSGGMKLEDAKKETLQNIKML